MDIRPIKTETDYEAALHEIEHLMDAELDTPEGDRLDILVTLVEAYEAKHYPMTGPDPIAAILHRMEALSMTRKDLEPLLGTRRCVSEVLARKRPLSLPMIRNIAKTMRIPADVLIQPYDTETSRAAS
jgi:HTH-type transcriptional regulator/antitoxin HigA